MTEPAAAATPQRTELKLPRLQGTAVLELHFQRSSGPAPASLYVALWAEPPATGSQIGCWQGSKVSLHHAGGRGGCLMFLGNGAVWINRSELAQVRQALIASGIEHSEHLGGDLS